MCLSIHVISTISAKVAFGNSECHFGIVLSNSLSKEFFLLPQGIIKIRPDFCPYGAVIWTFYRYFGPNISSSQSLSYFGIVLSLMAAGIVLMCVRSCTRF